MTFALRTLNGRFIWVILSVLVVLIGITLYAHQSVQHSAARSLEYIQTTRDLSQRLNAFTNLLQNTDSTLHQYSTFLSAHQHDELLAQIDDLMHTAQQLKNMPEVRMAGLLQTKTRELHEASIALAGIIRQYIDIMQNVESRYPGMPILMTHMEPTNRKFSEAVELALQEGELTESHPKVIARDHYRIMQLFQEARYAWSMQVSWFRVFVANRMGAFGDPESAMRNNLANRKMFANMVEKTLEKIDVYGKQGMLGLQQEESLEQMREALEYYNGHLDKAIEIYFSDHWRADIALLRDHLQPALNHLWETTQTIEQAIADINKLGIDRSQNTASLLSYFIWFFTGLISLLLFVAYQIFQHKIRRPVLQLADNMTIAGNQPGSIPRAEGNVEEINRLIDAYTAMRQQVDNRQRRLQSILDNAAEGVITIDEQGCIETFNLAAQKLFACDARQIIGKPFTQLLMPDELSETIKSLQQQFNQRQIDCSGREREIIGRRHDGSSFYMSIKFSEMQIGNKQLYTAIVSDISERRAVMDHLRHLAEHDSLTGLYNRQYFNDALERAFAQSRRNRNALCACIYIDLDNFKYINDTLGHLEGDRLLIGIANTLKARTRKSDILARLGGDEFALLLLNVDKEQAVTVAEGYRQAIASFSFIAGGKHIDSGCSIGVAMYEADLDTKEGLLARADIACHMAKRAGRNQVYLFEHTDKNHIDSLYQEMGWTRRIRHALKHDNFVFCCQPILKVSDGNIYSHELLLRMRDVETGDYIMPSGFLDSAERFGLMPEIDRWVIEHAFQWMNENAMHNDISYFINLSGKSIGDTGLLDYIKQTLPVLKINPQRIVFEITEDVAIATLDKARTFLGELRNIGFKTALDDFGVGYSSFSYLRELDVDYVKIDGAFINSMHTDELNLALVRAINDICHILGKETIAEFVQNDEALRLLREIGVDYAQGYNIATAADYDQHTIQFRLA